MCMCAVLVFYISVCVHGHASVHTLCACAGLSASNSTGRGSAQLRPGRRASGCPQDGPRKPKRCVHSTRVLSGCACVSHLPISGAHAHGGARPQVSCFGLSVYHSQGLNSNRTTRIAPTNLFQSISSNRNLSSLMRGLSLHGQ